MTTMAAVRTDETLAPARRGGECGHGLLRPPQDLPRVAQQRTSSTWTKSVVAAARVGIKALW